MKDTSDRTGFPRGWVEAAQILIENPESRVRCPSCDYESLSVFDVPYEESPHLRRYVVCESCGKSASMQIAKPGKDND